MSLRRFSLLLLAALTAVLLLPLRAGAQPPLRQAGRDSARRAVQQLEENMAASDTLNGEAAHNRGRMEDRARESGQDSLEKQAELDSAALQARADSIALASLRDSIDRWFWGEIDTLTLPQLDTISRWWSDSIARHLPDSSDIKRLKRRLRREEQDSIKASIPRVLATSSLPDSLYFRRILVWTADTKFNEMTFQGLDTTANDNFYEQPVMKRDISATTLGVSGSATLDHNWFRRREAPDAPMFTPYFGDSWTPDDIPQFNTKTPYTELAYWGTPFTNKKMEESNLKLLSTQNITPAFNFTLAYRRLGSRGMLVNENTDHRNTVIIGNYLGKRYFANFGTIRQRIERAENGGIRDSFWIRDTSIETKAIEVNLQSAANTYKRRTYFINHTLSVPMNFFRKDKDSLALGEGTMATLGHYGEFTTYSKLYTDNIGESDSYGRDFYFNKFYLDETTTSDNLKVRNLDNRVFLKLQPFASDALLSKVNAGVGYQILWTSRFDPADTSLVSHHNVYVYGGASGRLRKYIEWNADATYWLAGYKMFDFDINGRIRLSVYPIDKGIHLTGKVRSELRTPHPFEQHLAMNHHEWTNEFVKSSRTRVEGELSIPKWRLDATFGYALVTGLIYYDTLSVIRQHDSPVSVMSATLRKDFTLWRFHFDNAALFQLTSASDVLPLPKLTLNLRWYFDIDVVKDVMNVQLGVNAIANTRWYAPSYAPDTGQYYNQEREKIGNVPYFDIFANIQWKEANLFLKYTNAFMDWPSSDYFSAYHYIKPTSGIKFGILWPFYVK